jgi:predicted amidohydrolase YtcJ
VSDPKVNGRPLDQGAADVLLTGGRVHLGSATPGSADWVAVRSGRIAAVGAEQPPHGTVGPLTRVIDVGGGMVVPGFQDAHVHPTHGGLAELQCDLHDLPGRAAYRQAIASYAASNPDRPWIRGSGWALADFPDATPRREELDEIVPDRPVCLTNRDGHGVWVNSRALELAGITADTTDPVDGRIERDVDGSPVGTLHEGAMNLVLAVAPRTSITELEDAILLAQRRLHALGITAWQDAWVTPDDLAAYTAIAGRGELTARVVAAQWWERERGLEQVEEFLAGRDRGDVGRLRATSVKIMQDGICENYTAAMLAPYVDGSGASTANRGLSMVEPELLNSAVTRLDAEGFQVHFHAIGDRAVREALDACEAAIEANGRTDQRHHIAHIQFVHPDDVSRFRSLRITGNAQPFWACHEPQMDDLTIPFVGEAAGYQYPFLDLRRAGATLAFGSDWPVSTPNPLLEIEVAVNRIAPSTRELEPFLPDQRLDLATALDAFTLGSAFVNHLDDSTGSIRQGKLADLVVIDRDLFDQDAGPIGDARVVLTMVEGDVVHADPAFA